MADQRCAGHRNSLAWVLRFMCSAVVLMSFVSGVHGQRTITVSKDGRGNFMTVGGALNAATPGSRIVIAAGVYREQVRLRKSNIILIGVPGQTVIIYKQSAAQAGSTEKSATFIVHSQAAGFQAVGVTFTNDYGPNYKEGDQAVALNVQADSSFFNCRFIGWQDTLYAKKGRQFYQNCYIEGSVDFAFGAATAQFVNCDLYAKKRGNAVIASYTAQKRGSASETNGYVFVGGKLRCDPGVKAYLGRTWGMYARTVFIEVVMDDCITPAGWSVISGRGGTTTSFSAEYNCRGPGANRSGRVSWSRVLTPEQASFFRSSNFIGGPRPQPK
ncbi:hypothetical protein CBR_g12130 [Chara braunii]|uniref:pectinesterase n=1 Tax=Chara braunii TaxID=69332 RepID=A0A388KR64_CHABU|nr:hypothetical protein CBR_g12130 [Chara braunii]|eukprot:GBG72560.1 hypothetical protein CBR_g12130 [Chara braunii]